MLTLLLVGIPLLCILSRNEDHAFLHCFAGQAFYDDEGYIMVSIDLFNQGKALYSDIFSQYGPFFYLYNWLTFKLGGLPLTHDSVRLLTLWHWLVAALLTGAIAGLVTRSWFVFALTHLLAFLGLTVFRNEPGHPQMLVQIALAIAVLCLVQPGTGQIRSVSRLGAGGIGTSGISSAWLIASPPPSVARFEPRAPELSR